MGEWGQAGEEGGSGGGGVKILYHIILTHP